MSGALLLHHSFGPYHAARVGKLKQVLHQPLHLAELASSEALREWKRPDGLDVRTASAGVLENLPAKVVARGVRALLDELAPQVLIIAGYAHPGMREAARWAKERGARSILLSDSQALDKTRFRLKEAAKALWVQAHFDAAFTSGAAGAAYVQSVGIAPEKIWRGYDVVDNEYFARAAGEARAEPARLRKRLGLPDRFLLYVGRLSEEKNLFTLLDAWAAAKVAGCELVLVGGGPQEAKLRARAAKLRGVRLLGFLQQQDVAACYGLADALALPSTSEPWGLVVNEAMAAGLPVLVSTSCGCALDLVFPGVNGWLFSPSDVDALTRHISVLLSDDGLRKRMGAASEEIVAPWSLERWARAMADCIVHTLGSRE